MFKSLSIILPCYNEGEKLISNILKIKNYISESISDKLQFEIIIVNDGSTDDSPVILEEFCKNNCFCKLITYPNNRGKGFAVKKGIETASNDIIVFMDADLSTDLSALLSVYEFINDYNIVIGSRRHKLSILTKPQGNFRRFLGKSCSLITNFLFSFNISDTQCGFKAFSKEAIIDIIKKQTVHGFAFDVELLYIAYLNKYSIKEIPVTWENDEDSKVNIVSSSLLFLKDLLSIKFKKNFYKKRLI